MLVQSKSGTGKTLVFSVIAMEKFDPAVSMPQTLILSPTREIAVQTGDTLRTLGKYIPHFKTEVVIGGLSLHANRKDLQGCAVVVGSPGRILHLIELNVLNTKHIRLLILDEIDLLTELNFNLDKIVAALDRAHLQVITVSATLDKGTEKEVGKLMRNPIGITPAKEVPVLVGIGQFRCRLGDAVTGVEMLRKFAQLKAILSAVTFKQCFVFCNSQSLAESYRTLLAKEAWPSEVITGACEQGERLRVLRQLKEFKIRVLLSTDLMARGIDAENVNLVVNMDVPRNGMVYLHRIGRAGRFGTRGVAVTLVATEEQEKQFEAIQEQFGMQRLIMQWPEGVVESERVWAMVEEQERRTSEEDQMEKVAEKEEKEIVVEEEEEEEEEDALALLLDSSSLNVHNKGKEKKTSNILDEFDQFSESEVQDPKRVPQDALNDDVSLEDNVDSTEDKEEEEKMKEMDRDVKAQRDDYNSKKMKNKSHNCKNKSDRFAKWHTMFHAQCALITDFVEQNRQSRECFDGY